MHIHIILQTLTCLTVNFSLHRYPYPLHTQDITEQIDMAGVFIKIGGLHFLIALLKTLDLSLRPLLASVRELVYIALPYIHFVFRVCKAQSMH